ncbi:MAG TPA: Flp family type IVb pilin [Hyphomonadaceae bacterium]|jgi:pilus assembly protein Flp/PilA|nr:Flp family type IVb pilin [Hyphomonadaceae bacterium]HPI48210.1 Flp family type IVb pilin [Hyphomonadaceae bacterium]
MKNVMKFLKNKSGATAIEYGLIAALIAVAVIGGVSTLGQNANATFNTISSEM